MSFSNCFLSSLFSYRTTSYLYVDTLVPAPVRTVKQKPDTTSAISLAFNDLATSPKTMDPMDFLSGLSPVKAPRPPATPSVSRLSMEAPLRMSIDGGVSSLPANCTAPPVADYVFEEEVMPPNDEPDTPRSVIPLRS